jgi:exodeoxyribonuclease V alpha subunit
VNPRLLAVDEQLTGEVVGLVTVHAGTGGGLVRLAVDREPEGGSGVLCSGPLTDLVEGQVVTLAGRWRDRVASGRVFEAVWYEQVVPEPFAGLRAFLATAGFAAVPERSRDRVLTAFGAAAGRVIEHDPAQLTARAGLPPDEARLLHAAWTAVPGLAPWVQFVAPAAWPIEAVRGAHEHFGAETVAVARDDVYRLLEADRVRFAHVDRLARRLGVAPTDPHRLRAGALATVISARERDGHQHLDREACVAASARLLGVDRLLAAEGVVDAVAAGALATGRVDDVRVVSTPAGLRAEHDLAGDLARLLTSDSERRPVRLEGLEVTDELTAGQADAVRTAFRHPVSVVTGGPGAGRCRTIQQIVRVADAAELSVALATPTEGTATRLGERLRRPVTTIDRLLEARRGAERVPQELVVVAAASRCDTSLAARLVAAVDDRTRLVWVGDQDLLPSLGPGEVLGDLVGSGVIEVTALNETRPDLGASRLLGLVDEVRSGEVGTLRGADGNVFLAEEGAAGALVARVVQAVTERIPPYFGVADDQIQVLTPVLGGPAGVDALDAGLDGAGHPGRAMTIAQAQDGAWQVVVLVLDDAHRAVLRRELVYTAVTRAQRALIIVGQAETLRSAARTKRKVHRQTGLARRLALAAGPSPGIGDGGVP